MSTIQSRNSGIDLDRAVALEIKSRIAVTRGVTVKSAAEALDISRATLSARTNGHAPFSPSLIAKIAEILGTDVIELMAAAERRRRQATGAGQTNPGTPTTPTTASPNTTAEVAS